jgi:hypothetical protein
MPTMIPFSKLMVMLALDEDDRTRAPRLHLLGDELEYLRNPESLECPE